MDPLIKSQLLYQLSYRRTFFRAGKIAATSVHVNLAADDRRPGAGHLKSLFLFEKSHLVTPDFPLTAPGTTRTLWARSQTLGSSFTLRLPNV